ncbi:hypothetical protein LZL87_002437 [Fusarium oxysporum]|nr:hypothetical protein LZL87_002437 [Fusarium oxysporum]
MSTNNTPQTWLATTVDQPLLTTAPRTPGIRGKPYSHLQAVVVLQDFAYVETKENVPQILRGKMPNQITEAGCLMIFKGEPGYLFDRNPRNGDTPVIIFRGAMQVPVVLPGVILAEGRAFRSLTQQTADHYAAVSAPTVAPVVSIPFQPGDEVLQKFIRTFFKLLSTKPASLHSLRIQQPDIHEMFGEAKLGTHVEAILSAILPEVRETLGNGEFSLRDILDLRHSSSSWPGDRPRIYLRVYTHPRDAVSRPDFQFRDEEQTDINREVGFYVGQSRNIRRRNAEHDRATRIYVPGPGQSHYQIASKSLPENRHMIPLLFFDQPNISRSLLNMAEQVMFSVLNSCSSRVLATQTQDVLTDRLQRRARLMQETANEARQRVAWPELTPRGCNVSSLLFEAHKRVLVHCIPMAPNGGLVAHTFTTYRIRKSLYESQNPPGRSAVPNSVLQMRLRREDSSRECVVFMIAHDNEGRTGPKPDVKRGYFVAEIMDNKRRPHPRAYIGCPTVGTFNNFDEAS